MKFVIDGGTTNMRISLLKEDGTLVDQLKFDAGVRRTAIDGHKGYLVETLKNGLKTLMEKHDVHEVSDCIAYGMITSNMGLVEIPHLCAPVGAKELHDGMESHLFADIAPFPIRFIRGVRNFAGPVTLDNAAGMDMMRGEETEAAGLVALRPDVKNAMIVLPGSHNKFIPIDGEGRIMGCMTSISGELLDSLTHHTILADAVEHGFASAETYSAPHMLAGAKAADAGLGRAAFTARILRTLGDLTVEEARSFLLGTVLRLDLEALRQYAPDVKHLLVAGKPPLGTALCDLFAAYGYEAEALPEEIQKKMGIAGACAIAQGEC